MVDCEKKLLRQIQRRKRRANCQRIRDDQLLDKAYKGYTEEQKQEDEQLRIQVEWLSKYQR